MADSGTHTPLRVDMYHGDCLEVMPTLAAGSVDMVFADLPYGQIRRAWDKPIDLQQMWVQVFLVAKSSARFIFTATLPFAADLVVSQRKLFKHDLVFDKARSTGFLNANKRPLRRHEHVLVFRRGSNLYNPQKSPGKPYQICGRPADLNYMDNVKNNHIRRYSGERYPTSILTPRRGICKSTHPTQKPVELLEWLIKTYTNSGDTVLDPVSGSATTAIAAIRSGRNVICIEKDATYFAAGVERVKAEIAATGVNVDLRIHTV